MKTKRAMLMKPRQIEVMEVDQPLGDDQVLIKVASCGLCNWELNYWKGILRTDDYPYPLGHEYAGWVVEVGKNVTQFKVGDKVASLTGMQSFSEYTACDVNATFKLADHIDPRYVLGEPLKCIVTVLRTVNPQPGDYGVILGCGPMGQWCIQALAGKYLAGLIAIDVDDKKLEMAKSFGATATINSRKENALERLAELTNGRLGDFVIEGTGIPAVLNEAQDYVRFGGMGKLVLMSAHETVCNEFDFRKAVKKSIDLMVAHPGHSFNAIDDMRRAVALINNGTFQIKPLVSHEFPLSKINEAFDALEHKPAGYMKGIVYPD